LAYQAFEEVFATPRWRPWPTRAPGGSGRCGRPPASRTPHTPTRSTSSTWSPRLRQHHAREDPRAVADHGVVRGDTIGTGEYAAAQAVLDAVEALGISYIEVVEVLEREGVEKFEKSWVELLADVTGAARA
jgi:transaldolase